MDDSMRLRAIELCRGIEDSFDRWRDLGACFDALGRAWIEEQGEVEAWRRSPTQGLRKRMALYLWSLVEQTGLHRLSVNKALQYFALESVAPWVSHTLCFCLP